MYGTRWCFHCSDIRGVWHSKNSILRMSWNTSFGYVSKCVALEFNVFLLSQYLFFSCGGGHYIIPASSWHPNNRWCIDSRHQHPSSGLNGSSKKVQKINCCVCWVCCMPWVTRNFTCNSSPFSWMGGHGPSNNDWRIKMFKGCLGYLEWVDFQQDHGLCRMFCNIPINRQFIIQIEKWFRFLHIHFWMLLSGPSMFILSFPLRMDCCTKKHLHLT